MVSDKYVHPLSGLKISHLNKPTSVATYKQLDTRSNNSLFAGIPEGYPELNALQLEPPSTE